MKLITATILITRDTLNSTSFDSREFVKREVRTRLKAEYEETIGHSVSNAMWDILVPTVVELSTVLLVEQDAWKVKAQMMVPEETDLFKEKDNV